MGTPTRVLVVEDEWLIAEDHAARIRAAGYDVVGPVPSVKLALKAIDEEPIDAALLDIELLNETSYPIAERLREKGVPFTFLSGYAGTTLVPNMGECAVVSKPIQAGALVAAVERLMKVHS